MKLPGWYQLDLCMSIFRYVVSSAVGSYCRVRIGKSNGRSLKCLQWGEGWQVFRFGFYFIHLYVYPYAGTILSWFKLIMLLSKIWSEEVWVLQLFIFQYYFDHLYPLWFHRTLEISLLISAKKAGRILIGIVSQFFSLFLLIYNLSLLVLFLNYIYLLFIHIYICMYIKFLSWASVAV